MSEAAAGEVVGEAADAAASEWRIEGGASEAVASEADSAAPDAPDAQAVAEKETEGGCAVM